MSMSSFSLATVGHSNDLMIGKMLPFETLKSIARKVSVDEIKGIGVSGQMHGLVVLDENNDVLYDSIIWCDQRTEKEVNQIIDTIGKERYIDLTLNAPNTSLH